MRFTSHRPAPNYLARREQRRLLTLVMLLGLVMFLMHQASKPSSWGWFLLLNNQPAAGPAAGGDIDTRLKPAVETVAVTGAFVSPSDPEAPLAVPGQRFPGVRPELLGTVKDDTVFRGAEHNAFFHLLEILHDNDQASLDSASGGQVAFAQLYQQPGEYRGQLVGIRGTVRGAFPVTAAKNDYGIESYFQLWLQPYDNPNQLLVIYALELPKGFPVQDSLQEEVELTGFFFKRWAYRAQDAIRSAPLLLAKTVRWEPPVAAKAAPVNMTMMAGIVTCALLAAGIVVYLAMRGSLKSAYSGSRPPFQIGNPTATAEEPSPAEILKHLAERAEADSAVASDARSDSQGTVP